MTFEEAQKELNINKHLLSNEIKSHPFIHTILGYFISINPFNNIDFNNNLWHSIYEFGNNNLEELIKNNVIINEQDKSVDLYPLVVLKYNGNKIVMDLNAYLNKIKEIDQ